MQAEGALALPAEDIVMNNHAGLAAVLARMRSHARTGIVGQGHREERGIADGITGAAGPVSWLVEIEETAGDESFDLTVRESFGGGR